MFSVNDIIIAYSLGLLTEPFIRYILIPYILPDLKKRLKDRLGYNGNSKKKGNKKKKKKKRRVKETTVTKEYVEDG